MWNVCVLTSAQTMALAWLWKVHRPFTSLSSASTNHPLSLSSPILFSPTVTASVSLALWLQSRGSSTEPYRGLTSPKPSAGAELE